MQDGEIVTIHGKQYPVIPVKCPDCDGVMALRPSRFGVFYGCLRYPACKGAHGAHPDGRPLGVPASRDTKVRRMAAHERFDSLWKCGDMTRTEAYSWMQKAMQMTKDQAHIANFTMGQCEKLIEHVTKFHQDVVDGKKRNKRS